MFSIARLLGRDDVFFDLLEGSAREARDSVKLALDLLKSPERGAASLDEFALLRRKDKRITERLSELITTTFVTPLEREDLETLSNVLYKIPKTLEKFGERFVICRGYLGPVDFSRQAQLLESATESVEALVKQLRAPRLEKVKELNDRLQFLEGEADKLMVELLRGLYQGETNPVRVIALKDLYELLEKVIDRCRDAGNVIFHVVLKNS